MNDLHQLPGAEDLQGSQQKKNDRGPGIVDPADHRPSDPGEWQGQQPARLSSFPVLWIILNIRSHEIKSPQFPIPPVKVGFHHVQDRFFLKNQLSSYLLFLASVVNVSGNIFEGSSSSVN